MSQAALVTEEVLARQPPEAQGKLAERWAQVDFEDVKRQLTGPTQ